MERRGLIGTLDEWCKGRCWVPRALLLLWFVYIGVRHLLDPKYCSVFKAINLGIHEGGHLLFGLFGIKFLGIAGGTLLQLLVPMVAVFIFLRQRDYFAICFAGVWIATNLYDVAVYVADARALALPLVTVGPSSGPVTHDWNYMLFHLGLIEKDTTIAAGLRAGAFLALWGPVTAGACMCYRMAHHARAERRPATERGAAPPPPPQPPGTLYPNPPSLRGRIPHNRRPTP